MPKDKDDSLENTEAVPKEIPSESSSTVGLPIEGYEDTDLDRACVGEADTDRFDVSGGGQLIVAPKLPTSLRFSLKNIRSLNAKCFFCKELECDLVFMAKSSLPAKTRAYAAHSDCVFDHEMLQDLPSGGL
jgi:hypothetical protein